MPIEKGCTHCGSDQHNTTECPMMVAAKDQLDLAPLARQFNEAPAEALRPEQSAPAGERQALQRLLDDVRDIRNADDVAFGWDEAAEYFGAAWQRTQSAPPASPEGRECPRYVCRKCKQETRPPEPYEAYVLCDCGYMTSATTALAAATQPAPTCATCSGVSLVGRNPDHGEPCPECSGSTQPAAQSELPAEVIAAAIRSVPAWSEISADLLAWEIFDYLYPGKKRKTVNGHYINCNAVSQFPAGKCNCGKGA